MFGSFAGHITKRGVDNAQLHEKRICSCNRTASTS